jgi:hypothetical protein
MIIVNLYDKELDNHSSPSSSTPASLKCSFRSHPKHGMLPYHLIT